MMESAQLEASSLQAEVGKLQERRHKDVRDLKQKLQSQVTRYDDAAKRLHQSCQDDTAMWTQKVRNSEARASKLENDVQAARKNLQALPAKAASLEAENVELLASVEKLEAKLRQAEGTEGKRQADLAKLRNAHKKVQTRTK